MFCSTGESSAGAGWLLAANLAAYNGLLDPTVAPCETETGVTGSDEEFSLGSIGIRRGDSKFEKQLRVRGSAFTSPKTCKCRWKQDRRKDGRKNRSTEHGLEGPALCSHHCASAEMGSGSVMVLPMSVFLGASCSSQWLRMTHSKNCHPRLRMGWEWF